MMACKVCGNENKENNIIKCQKCGHIFRNFEKIDLKEYYSKKYRNLKNNGELPRHVYDSRNAFILSKISNFIDQNSNFLEVGFGYGHFFRALNGEYPNIKYTCCEMSKSLSENNMKKGIRTFNSSFQEIPVKEKFDVIASFDVLEHLYEPKSYIAKMNQLLNIGGICIIQVPTDRQIHFKKPFDGHYHYFSEISLRKLLENEYENLLFYKTKRGETANGREFLTVFRKIK